LAQEQQLEKIKNFIKRLDNDEYVSLRDMRAVLTDEEFEGYENDWKGVRALRVEQKELAANLKDYEDLLRVADGIFTGTVRETQAQGAYEKALERLQELLGQNVRLSEVLDRGVSFKKHNATEASAEGVPRSIFSRSHNARDGGVNYGTINDVKRQAFERKIEVLETMDKTAQKQTETPKQRLERLKRV
jgi:hypothetical protein